MANGRDPRPNELGSGETLPFTTSGQVAREVVVTGSGAFEGLAPGTRVGDWIIDGKIGQGGMGSVHAATHPVIGKRAAIKVVHAELCRSAGTAERFVQEARVVNQICHPNIVDIFDLGQLPDGRPYLVMELLRGRTLGDRLEQGRLSALDAIDLLLQIADPVAAAHARGVVHRDLKPDNIYLTEGTRGVTVKVVDWGIAKLRDVPPASVALTTSGMVLGTPRYVSPEQARGKALDDRSDVYSLGIIAYEVVLEGPPFVADSVADMIAMHLREPPPPPSDVWPDVPDALERLLLAMLAKDAPERPSMLEVIATLRAVRAELEGRTAAPAGRRFAAGSTPPPLGAAAVDPARLPTVPAAEPPTRPVARWPVWTAGLAVVALIIVGLIVLEPRSVASRRAATPPSPGVPEAPRPAPAPAPVGVVPAQPPIAAPPAPAVAPTDVTAPPARPTRRERTAAIAAPSAPAPAVAAPTVEPDPTAPTGRTLFKEGLQRFVAGDTVGAIAKYQDALAREPDLAAAHRGLGMALERQGDRTRAARAYRRYLELAPDAADAAQIRDRLARLR